MNAYEKIRAALEFSDLATGGKLIPKDSTIKDALAALAELERAAAAPDMFAVLHELSECSQYWSDYDVPLGIHDRIKAALAKAGA